jgi:rhodanese-related sulfurtransferase
VRSRRPHHSRQAGQSDLGGALIGALAIVLASAALGILVNHFSSHGIPIIAKGGQLPLPPGIEAMTVAQARAALDAKSALFLDARIADEYPKSHLPGALSLPPESFNEKYPDLAERVEAAGTVIIYCESPECGDSILVAERLREVFAGKVYVVEGGWGAWVAAGYPVTTGSEP